MCGARWAPAVRVRAPPTAPDTETTDRAQSRRRSQESASASASASESEPVSEPVSLTDVKGIGPKTVEKLRPWVEVKPPSDAKPDAR